MRFRTGGRDQGEGYLLNKTQNITIWLLAHQLMEVGEGVVSGVGELLDSGVYLLC